MRAHLVAVAVLAATALACSGGVNVGGVTPVGTPVTGDGTTASPHAASCSTTALDLRRGAGQEDIVACPAGCTGGPVWGTGRYTGDSKVCSAAIHAGALPAAGAGIVRLNLLGTASSFTGSTANGVTSQSWGAASDLTFGVTTAGAPPPAPDDGGGRRGKGGKGGKNR